MLRASCGASEHLRLQKSRFCAENKIAVRSWVLKVELDGEWEQCVFATRKEALATFVAVAADYQTNLCRAILFATEEADDAVPGRDAEPAKFRYLN